MEGMVLYLLAAFVICFPAPSHSALYVLITPDVLRVETEEQIVVEAHGDVTAKQVDISILAFPQTQRTLYQMQANMNPNEGMIVSPKIKIPMKELKKDSKQNQYVIVQARCSAFTLEKVVLLSFQTGYLFIQTDKTIYTPGSPVLFRVFSMDYNMQLMDKTVIVEIVNPEGIIVNQNPIDLSPKPLIRPYNLPETVSLGTWKITAKYQDSPKENFTSYFTVQEYVLPSFEVLIQPPEKFLYIDDNNDFRVSITARYLYGKKVDGVAFVLFGVKIDDEKKSIPDSLQRIPIIEGDGEAVLKRTMLQTRFRNLNELVGHSLYISVTVMTESGSDMVVTERTGISIVTSPYKIFFTKTPKYFKPGMPYELTAYVTNPDDSPAANIPVVSEPIHAEATTLKDGTAKLILNTPVNSQELQITVKTKHPGLPRERQASKSIRAVAYETQGGSGNYLHLAVTSTEIKSGDNLPINFNVRGNNQALLNQIQYFTYLILTKGRIYKIGRQPRIPGQNLVTMTLRILPEFIPSFRIVAYYQIGNNEIVADSVWVDVKDTCMGTLVVKGASERDNQIHEPGTSMKIKLEGDQHARVGLVAVDKAVYVLNKKHKISQSKIWDTVEKSDIGCTAGSGRNQVGVFEDAGLALETSNKINTKQRTDPKCPQPAKRRRRRSVLLIDTKANKAAEFKDHALRKCCEDGMRDNPMGHNCEKRAQYILEGDACKAAFLECCKYISNIRDKNKQEEELLLARSDFEDEFLGDEDVISRTEFPESWLWQTEFLTDPPNNQGYMSSIAKVYITPLLSQYIVLYCFVLEHCSTVKKNGEGPLLPSVAPGSCTCN